VSGESVATSTLSDRNLNHSFGIRAQYAVSSSGKFHISAIAISFKASGSRA
jgi:hypothetical protein